MSPHLPLQSVIECLLVMLRPLEAGTFGAPFDGKITCHPHWLGGNSALGSHDRQLSLSSKTHIPHQNLDDDIYMLESTVGGAI